MILQEIIAESYLFLLEPLLLVDWFLLNLKFK